jgi:dTDP-4-amino-4,6-dideoxy-D-galactose acyltransferase
MTHPPCRLLEWDSQFFGRRIARVCAARIGPADVERIEEWADAEAVECLYYLAPSEDQQSIRTAERAGFLLADVRLTREHDLAGVSRALPESIEPFRPEDVPALRAIARVSHRDSRFYFDTHFPRDRCDALYETWIEKSCAGDESEVLVARHAGSVAGYVTCELGDDEWGAIGLFAVAAESRGSGFGHRLLEGALTWFAAQGCRRARVASQARNVAGSRAYEGVGFRTLSVEHSYHLWLPRTGPGITP